MSCENAHIDQYNTFWEKVAASTRWGAYTTEIEKRVILKAHDLSREPGRALEIGVEGGRWSALLTDLGWSMICTDINENTLAICKERIPSASCILVRTDEKRLPCESESIGLLLCIEVSPVMQADWFISEATRVLQNDGIMVGVFMNLLSFRGFFAHMRSSFKGEYDYYELAYPSWRMQLLGRGYSMLYEEGFCWFPFNRTSNSVFVPYFVRLEKWFGLNKLAIISPWIAFIAKKTPKRPLSQFTVF